MDAVVMQASDPSPKRSRLKPLLAIIVVAAAFHTDAPAQAREPETLARSGKWRIDYGRDACYLFAAFGEGKDMLVMRIARYQPGDPFDLNFYGGRFALNDVIGSAKIDFGLRDKPVEVRTVNGYVGKTKAIFLHNTRLDGWQWKESGPEAPPITPEQEAAVSTVTVEIAGRKPFRLEFGSLAKPMEILRDCQADLLKTWGYDPAVQAILSKRPLPMNSASGWLSSDDYPNKAVIHGFNGFVRYRLDIDADGKVTGCQVIDRTKPDLFADITCNAVSRRAKFEPALDAVGKPVPSFYLQNVIWIMPSQ